ncbi:MAG: hypothetical protein FWG20_04895, partial [Candidatus Cloacimonetes bacterium]|nr:hypothetical protein [Candidatus Cloacimonadota bacterium]
MLVFKVKVTCVLFLLLYFLSLSSSIYEITDISNPDLRFRYDKYWGTVLKYEDRLITSNMATIDEYRILPGGSLEKISFFEYDNNNSCSIIDDGKYYFLDNEGVYYTKGLYIIDLSVCPMELLDYIPLNLVDFTGNLFCNDEFIFISDHFEERVVMINKATHEIDGYINDFAGSFISIIGDVIINPYYNTITQAIILKAFILNENLTVSEISSIEINGIGNGITDIVIFGNRAVVTFQRGLVIVDFSDIHNPYIFSSIYHIEGFDSALLTENYLFAQRGYKLIIYDIDAVGNTTLKYVNDTGSNANHRNLLYSEPFLYANAGTDLRVYHISEEVTLLHSYGLYWYYPPLCFSEDDIYYMEMDYLRNTQKVYTILGNELICSLNHTFPIRNAYYTFALKDDKLFMPINLGWISQLNVYQISNQQAVLQNSISFEESINSVFIIDDKVYISYLSPDYVEVYDLVGNELEFITSFAGQLQFRYSTINANYLLNRNGSELFIRELDGAIITQMTIPSLNNSAVNHLSDQYIAIFNMQVGYTQAYSFDFNGSYTNLYGTNTAKSNTYNSVLSVSNDWLYEYFTIYDGAFRQIGAKTYENRNVHYTYFMPNQNKMIQVADSGIWVYDFAYNTTSEKDENVVKNQTELMNAYPNPFNPNTTIKYYLKSGSFVCLDIYNIKGQKV